MVHAPSIEFSDWLESWNVGRSLPASLAVALGVTPSVLVTALLALITLTLAWSPSSEPGDRRWAWPITGSALGLLGLLAWLIGAPAGWHWGLAMTGPSRSLVELFVRARPDAATWGTMMLIGVPLGSWLSARALGRVPWRPAAPLVLVRRFFGGILMGVGGTLAAGCNVGNALTGLSVLSFNSAIATVSILAGGALAIRAPYVVTAVSATMTGRGRMGGPSPPGSLS